MAGVAMSLSTQEAQATNLDSQDSVRGNIPCWSSGNVNPAFRYVACGACASTFGQPTGGQGSCSSGSHGISAIR